MLRLHVLDVAQPVVGKPDTPVRERGGDPAAAEMPADDDVLDLEQIDRELHDREAIQVGMHDDVGDVAVDEELARGEVDDLVRGNAAVGAADPEIARALLARKAREELRILAADALRPAAILVEELAELAHEVVAPAASSAASKSSKTFSRPS